MNNKGTMSSKQLRVTPVKNGTVIDHIEAGQALNVLKILGITPTFNAIVSAAMNVPSERMGKKDIVKVEGKELMQDELRKIALIAPRATINIIRNFDVTEKYHVDLPPTIEGVLRCANPNCISNTNEPVKSRFIRENGKYRCYYCDRIAEDIVKNLL